MERKHDKPKGYIIGLYVEPEVYVIRDGKKVVVARYENDRGARWKRSTSSSACSTQS